MSKQTPLYSWHVSNGARLSDFGGYEMPLWYSSVKEEHLSVLLKAGMFDTSHMAVVMASGPDAFDLLQECFTRDLGACLGLGKKPIVVGRCVYGAFLNRDGEVIDDAIVYKLGNERFMVVVNAGMGATLFEHLRAHKKQREVGVVDLSGEVAKIDLQGPASGQILRPLLDGPEDVFNGLAYFSFKGDLNSTFEPSPELHLIDQTSILLSRTGYTGEFGFEIFLHPHKLQTAWEMILDAGQAQGVIPCGLAARDSLRAGAVLPLSHQDIGPWPFVRHPWEFALPWNKDRSGFTKAFIGDRALLQNPSAEYTVPFVGNDLRKVTVSDPAVVVDTAGTTIGTVLTCVSEMGIGRQNGRIYSLSSPDKPDDFTPKGLCCGFIKTAVPLAAGTVVKLRDKRRTIPVAIAETIRPDLTARKSLKEFVAVGTPTVF